MEKVINYRSVAIQYQLKGSGPVLVLVHGFLEDASIFNPFLKELNQHFTTIQVDLPGHGQSETLKDLKVEDFGHILLNILAQEEITGAYLLGHSMGGYAVLSTLMQNSPVIKGVALFHSTANADTLEKKNNRDKAIELVKANHHKFLSAFMPNLFMPQNVAPNKEAIKALIDLSKQTSSEAAIACMKAMRDRPDYRSAMNAFKGKKHFIIGKEDPVLPCTELVAQAIETGSKYTVLENVGHMGFIESPEQSVQAIISYIKD